MVAVVAVVARVAGPSCWNRGGGVQVMLQLASRCASEVWAARVGRFSPHPTCLKIAKSSRNHREMVRRSMHNVFTSLRVVRGQADTSCWTRGHCES